MALDEQNFGAPEVFNALVDHSSAGCFIFVQGNLVYANEKLAEIAGVPKCNLISSPLDELLGLVDADYLQVTARSMNLIVNGGSAVFLTRSKSGLYCDVSGASMTYQGVTVAYGTVLDVNERESLKEELSRCRRYAVLGGEINVLTHDMKTIIGPVVNYAQFLRRLVEKHGLESLLAAPIDRMISASSIVRDRVIAILDFSNVNLNKSAMGINDVFYAAVDDCGIVVEGDYRVTSALDSKKLILGDRQAIYMTLFNLVVNAREAMPEGGNLLIATEDVSVKALLGKFGPIPDGNYVKVVVSDSGTGIDSKQLSKLFEPLISKKPLGYGLGLASVYQTVLDHNGCIDVKTKLGEGTSFELYFPSIEIPDFPLTGIFLFSVPPALFNYATSITI